jgi:MipA family protein
VIGFDVFGNTGVRRLARRIGAALLAMLLSAASAPTAAQEISEQELEQKGLGEAPSGKWDITLGAGIGAAPAFPGAQHERLEPVPFAAITYDNLIFLGPLGIGINALRWSSADSQYGFRAGPVLGYGGGRQDSADPHLNGLGNIEPSLTAGLFASYRAGPFEFSATARQAIIHSENGLVGLVSLNYQIPIIAKTLNFSIGPELTVGNAEYSETWFGVSATQGAQSGLPAFMPSSGVLLEPGVHASATYRYSEHVFVRAFANVKELTGDDANSPIVQSKTQAAVGLGAGYHF